MHHIRIAAGLKILLTGADILIIDGGGLKRKGAVMPLART